MDADLAQLSSRRAPAADDWWPPWREWLDVALHREVLRLRLRYELSTDELRGLYVSDEQVDRLLLRERPSDRDQRRLDELSRRRADLLAAARASSGPLGRLAAEFGLAEHELLALLVCLAPETDLGYQGVYAYLNDDAARRLPTVDLCARLADGRLLRPDDPVLAHGLLQASRPEAAPLWRSAGLHLAEPVRASLLDRPEAAGVPEVPGTPPGRHGGPSVLVLESHSESDAVEAAARLLGVAADRLVRVAPVADHAAAAWADPFADLSQALLLARLHGAALLLTAEELGLAPDGTGAAAAGQRLRRLAEAPVPVAVVLPSGAAARLELGGIDAERVVVARADVGDRAATWRRELTRHRVGCDPDDVAAVADLFALDTAGIAGAARSVSRSASRSASRGPVTVGRADLAAAARERCATTLHGIAPAVPTTCGWDDLVLPPATRRRVAELAQAVRHRHRVFDTWSFGRLVGGHTSVRALFSGPPGTGKTMSASVVAGELGLPLHRVDLSAVVSKYVGETEKNIERVLTAAEEGNAMLLFDEADALFGKRTEVKDAHDRYANIETAYLLQRLETFDGVVVLATNLAGNLDEAFARRIHVHVDFPVPDEELRVRLWQRALPDDAPVADDVDPRFLAGMFSMTGGDIHNAALTAAFMAARDDRPIGMAHLVRALARQRRRQGKVPSAAEFGDWLRLARDEDA